MNSSKIISINSGHISDAIDSQIVLLVKTIQIENNSKFDDALETARDFINKKIIELMIDSDKKNIKDISINIRKKLKETPNNKELESMYKLCKYFGLYKYLE